MLQGVRAEGSRDPACQLLGALGVAKPEQWPCGKAGARPVTLESMAGTKALHGSSILLLKIGRRSRSGQYSKA